MAPHGKELSEELKKRIAALHKDGIGYKKIAKTLKLSCSTVAKTIQRCNRTGSTQNRPRHGRPKKLSARAQRHIQRLCLGNRHMSAASIAAEVEGVGGQRVSAQTIRRTLHQIGLHGCRPRRKPLLKMMHKKACKQFAEDKQTKEMDYWNMADTLDPALLHPGRLDCKIEFPLPDRRQKRLVLTTITSKMNLSEEVDLEDYVARPDKISDADINSICQEAGMLAVRENRYIVLAKDFEKAYKTVIKKDEQEHEFYK
ncbi:26S proteasome regulatory subunit 6B isoform X2 [Chanodichthys erythropterus]